MKMKKLNNNIFSPFVEENEWYEKYPKADKEYVWSYPLVRGGTPFNPNSIFEETEIPIASTDTIVYVHVPACLHQCPMCAFYVEVVKSRKALKNYKDAIIKEIKMYKKAALTKKLNLTTIYFGGGTASLLYPEDVKEIIDEIKKVIPYKNDIEITLEGHPCTVDYNYLSAVKEYGVNRVSFGIQSFDDSVLKKLGLKQRAEFNDKVLKQSVELGFDTVAADMLYRLPNQTIEHLKAQLDYFLSYGITNLSTYSLELSERQSFLKAFEPNQENDEKMFYFINDYMEKKGWNHTAQPDYSHPNHVQQEIMTSWHAPQGQTIGLGAGGCSSFNNVNYYNVHDVDEYINVLNEDCFPVLIGQEFTIEDAMSRYAVLGARCFYIEYEPFEKTFGVSFAQKYEKQIGLLKSQGLIEVHSWGIEVTRKGKYYVDNISKEFYAEENKRHLQPWGEKMKGAVATSYLYIGKEQ